MMTKPQARTTFQLLEEMSAVDPDHEALVEVRANQRWSYGRLLNDVSDCARALLASGIRHGDRVGILAGNRAEWIIAYFGINAIGAISVGLNTWASAHELAYQVEHAAMKLLFIEPQFKDRDFTSLVAQASGMAAGIASQMEVVSFDTTRIEGQITWREFLRRKPQAPEAFDAAIGSVKGTDVACLLYTSGSTALPKGVPLLHQGLMDNMWDIGERQHLQADDRLWLAVSLFWSLACVNALFALMTHRATIVLQHHFDAAEALAIIEQERCTVFYGTPNMALAMTEAKALQSRDTHSLRTGVTIGTSVQVQRVADLGVNEICNVYGLTEAYGNSAVTDSRLPLAKRLETVGQLLPGQEAKIVDPESLETRPINETGEIFLRGNVTRGYWEDPARTAESFVDGGWFRTGDLGFLDGDGFLHFRGRLKEMVKTGGINVAPAEVEEVLSTHPAVELVFVTGIPDARLDEALAAVIVLRAGMATDESALRAHCRRTMAPYKTPRHFRFVASQTLPLTSTGKLQRNRLHELF